MEDKEEENNNKVVFNVSISCSGYGEAKEIAEQIRNRFKVAPMAQIASKTEILNSISASEFMKIGDAYSRYCELNGNRCCYKTYFRRIQALNIEGLVLTKASGGRNGRTTWIKRLY